MAISLGKRSRPVDDGPRSPRVERSSAMPTYFLTHHFPKDFRGSPETASAATAWFASMGVNLVGRGGNPTVQPQRLGNWHLSRNGTGLCGKVMAVDTATTPYENPRVGDWRRSSIYSGATSPLWKLSWRPEGTTHCRPSPGWEHARESLQPSRPPAKRQRTERG